MCGRRDCPALPDSTADRWFRERSSADNSAHIAGIAGRDAPDRGGDKPPPTQRWLARRDREQLSVGEHLLGHEGRVEVSFAVEHPAHFTVMFGPHGDDSDPDLAAARDRAGAILDEGVADLPHPPPEPDRHDAAIAAWSLVHGFATLWLNGALSLTSDADPTATAGRILNALLAREPDPPTSTQA